MKKELVVVGDQTMCWQKEGKDHFRVLMTDEGQELVMAAGSQKTFSASFHHSYGCNCSVIELLLI